MSNPFKKISKNAEESTNTEYYYEVTKGSKVSSKQCDSCGAPRPKNTDLTSCDYCKTPFMSITKKITTDF